MELCEEDIYSQIINAKGHVLVTGGPGSGKTTTALKKAIKFIDDKKLRAGQNVLFLSFSKAAVARINQTSHSLDEGGIHKKELCIQTFHSFFWEIIKTHGYLLGSSKKIKVLPPYEEDSLKLGRKDDSEEWIAERKNMFIRQGLVSFDLFAPLTLEIMTHSPKILNIITRKFPLIIVDESQDTDTEQWECIKKLSQGSEITLLADIDQQIYDYRKNVSSERLNEIVNQLNPIQFKLGTKNFRSSTTEILAFASDLKNNLPRAEIYSGISCLNYSPQAAYRDKQIRQSIGILCSKIENAKGGKALNVAILATWGRGVKIISQALRGNEQKKEIKHKVQFDETTALLSSKVIAFLLEPKFPGKVNEDLITILCYMSDILKAKGKKKEDWEKYDNWCKNIHNNQIPRRGKIISELKGVLNKIYNIKHSGNPGKDWLRIKEFLLVADSKEINELGKNAEYLMVFNRGKKISAGLNGVWKEKGIYENARTILTNAIVESQIMSDDNELRGVHVMTIHKAKGKEFDGVIIFYDPNSSPLILSGDKTPFARSRKLLFVGITRARFHTLILKNATVRCPILDGFNISN
ncbi:MAG: UvrD-helicase domain-containing protein [Patescibacteria group bacterium]